MQGLTINTFLNWTEIVKSPNLISMSIKKLIRIKWKKLLFDLKWNFFTCSHFNIHYYWVPWILSKQRRIFAFLRKVVRENHTHVTSCWVQLKRVGRGLLQEALQGEGECYVRKKRWGQTRKDWSWKTEVNIGTFKVNKNKCSITKHLTKKKKKRFSSSWHTRSTLKTSLFFKVKVIFWQVNKSLPQTKQTNFKYT